MEPLTSEEDMEDEVGVALAAGRGGARRGGLHQVIQECTTAQDLHVETSLPRNSTVHRALFNCIKCDTQEVMYRVFYI